MSTAMPVKPLERICTGFKKVCMAKACSRADTITAAVVMAYRLKMRVPFISSVQPAFLQDPR